MGGSAVAEVEIRLRGRPVERLVSQVDPDDEFECVALLRRRAHELAAPGREE